MLYLVFLRQNLYHANGTTELLTAPLVLEESEILKVTAATANRLHVVLSSLEVQKRTVTT